MESWNKSCYTCEMIKRDMRALQSLTEAYAMSVGQVMTVQDYLDAVDVPGASAALKTHRAGQLKRYKPERAPYRLLWPNGFEEGSSKNLGGLVTKHKLMVPYAEGKGWDPNKIRVVQLKLDQY